MHTHSAVSHYPVWGHRETTTDTTEPTFNQSSAQSSAQIDSYDNPLPPLVIYGKVVITLYAPVCDIAAYNKLQLFCTHKDVNVLIGIKLGQSIS